MASLVVAALSLNCLRTARLVEKLMAGYFSLPTEGGSWTRNGDVGVSHTLEVDGYRDGQRWMEIAVGVFVDSAGDQRWLPKEVAIPPVGSRDLMTLGKVQAVLDGARGRN